MIVGLYVTKVFSLWRD